MIASALANHLWQSTLVAAIACVVTLALRRERAAVRHGVWLAASLKFLVPFAVLTSLGTRFGWRRPIVVASFTPYDVIVDASGGLVPPTAVRFAARSVPHPVVTAVADVLPAAMAAVWVVGAIALVALWVVRWRRVANVVRASRAIEHGPIVDSLRRAEHRAGITRPVRLVSSQNALEPGVFGIVAPTLVWPARLSDHLSTDQIEGILAHEATHVVRRDNFVALLHMGVQAAFWFHPMVWWIGRRLVDERERACDEAVVRAGSTRDTYAESILKTCQFFVESPLTCVSGVTGSDLKKRIERIMTGDTGVALNVWKKILLGAAAAAVVAVPFVVGVITTRPVYAQQSTEGERRSVIDRREIQVRVRELETMRARVGEIYGRAQANAPVGQTPAFDVTSVKPNNSGANMIQMLPAANGGWQATNVTVGIMLRIAYQMQDNQILDAPKWFYEDRFDVVGTGTAPDRAGPMPAKLRSLLEDRFRLVTHMDKRELPVYALVLARRDGKLGPQIALSTADCPTAATAGRGRGPQVGQLPGPGERPKCGFMVGPASVTAGGASISMLTTNLSRMVGGIVVDNTGLTGTYDFTLSFAPDPGLGGRSDFPGGPPPGADRPAGDGPSIFAALQEQLGLKLESTKAPVDVLVIDRAERPRPD